MKRPKKDDMSGDMFDGLSIVPEVPVELLADIIASTRPVLPEHEAHLEIFKRLFRGRSDAFSVYWGDIHGNGRHGYMPACENDRHPLLCQRPQIPCRDCKHRQDIPFVDAQLSKHLDGRKILGLYTLLPNSTCYLLVVDFDKEGWKADAKDFIDSCRELGVPVSLEISRSGNGAHAWIFFDVAVTATKARRLGTAILSHACARTGKLEFSSYDRFIPGQDIMPKGGYGNLISLPLQPFGLARGCTAFVDENFEPYPDQWAYLASVQKMFVDGIDATIFNAVGDTDPLDIAFALDKDWDRGLTKAGVNTKPLTGVIPKSITICLEDGLYFDCSKLPSQLTNKLARLASFQNPVFYKTQALGYSVYKIPRVETCANITVNSLVLPRGCLFDAQQLLKANGIAVDFDDKRFAGIPINVTFHGALRDYQSPAFDALMEFEDGILLGGTSFGKTVVAAAAIARRGVNTIILIEKTTLIEQWQDALKEFLHVGDGIVGIIGDGENCSTGIIDIVLMQSLSEKGKLADLIRGYGHVIVDECHHLGAKTYENLIGRAKAKYYLGLSASKKRRDGHYPKVIMQCGPIRYYGEKPKSDDSEILVKIHWLPTKIPLPKKCKHTALIDCIVDDPLRMSRLLEEIESLYNQGRRILVLTSRVDHLLAVHAALVGKLDNLLIIRGCLTTEEEKSKAKKDFKAFCMLPPDAPRVITTTTNMAGEGFNHPPLNTLVYASPFSWEEDIKQHCGRVDRNLAENTDTWIIDFIDMEHDSILKMWKKRKSVYKKQGYRIVDRLESMELFVRDGDRDQ